MEDNLILKLDRFDLFRSDIHIYFLLSPAPSFKTCKNEHTKKCTSKFCPSSAEIYLYSFRIEFENILPPDGPIAVNKGPNEEFDRR